MKKWIYACLVNLSALFALLTGIVFLSISLTGYLEGRTFNAGVGILAIITAVVIFSVSFENIIGEKIATVIRLVGSMLLAVTFILLLVDKAGFIGDSFIPMDYPSSFWAAIGGTYTVISFNVLAFAFLSAASFVGINGEKADNG